MGAHSHIMGKGRGLVLLHPPFLCVSLHGNRSGRTLAVKIRWWVGWGGVRGGERNLGQGQKVTGVQAALRPAGFTREAIRPLSGGRPLSFRSLVLLWVKWGWEWPWLRWGPGCSGCEKAFVVMGMIFRNLGWRLQTAGSATSSTTDTV